MFNKKIMSAAIASAVISAGSQAAVDMNAGTGSVVVANDEIGTGAETLTNAALLDFVVDAGLNLPAGTAAYVRFDLGNAKFGTAVAAGDLTNAVADTNNNRAISKENGGADGDNYVVFKVSDADDALSTTDNFTLADVDDYDVTDVANPFTVQYRVWSGTDAALNAANAIGTPLASTGPVNVATFASGRGSDIADAPATQIQADVAGGFKTFANVAGNANVASTTVASLGNIDLTTIATSTITTSLESDLTALEAVDVWDEAQAVTFTGDFTVGTWKLHDAIACTGGNDRALTLNDAKTTATAASADFTAAEWHLCVTMPGDTVIPRVETAYSFTLADDGVSADLGTITYNSSTIEIDYLTTFSGYNQRIYLVNTSNSAANYSTTFTTESGTTAQAGSKASGTIPANSVLVVKATDLVTLTGATTRTAARIDVEASASSIQASTQTVNTGDSSTDTVKLTVE